MLVSPAMLRRPKTGGGSQPKPPTSTVATLPAPMRGWVTTENLAMVNPGGADVLENFIPTLRGIRPRGGKFQHAFITDPCTALMGYRSGTSVKVFGCTDTDIYDVTAPASPTVAPTAAVSSQTSGDYSHVNFSTSGGSYLVAVNASNARQLFDGSSWSTSPAMTGGPGTNGDQFSHVWVYNSRLYFVKKDSLNVYYLGTDAVGGALTLFPMVGIFQNGGEIMFGGTWSADTGSGLSDSWIVVTNVGEVAIFQGSYPGGTDWGIVGRYEIGRPLGKNAIMRAGGDLLVATLEGLISLSAVISKDKAALALTSVTAPILDQWQALGTERTTSNWSITRWNSKGYAIVGISTIAGQDEIAFAVNLNTGAWSKITGWDVACSIEVGDDVYFGEGDGKIYLAEVSGSDNGELYYCTYIGLPENFGALASNKTALMMRATFIHTTDVIVTAGIAANYSRSVGVYPSSPVTASDDVWDTGLWDVARWDAGGTRTITTEWISVSGSGNTLAPLIQMTFGTSQAPDIELVSIELLYETGDIVA